VCARERVAARSAHSHDFRGAAYESDDPQVPAVVAAEPSGARFRAGESPPAERVACAWRRARGMRGTAVAIWACVARRTAARLTQFHIRCGRAATTAVAQCARHITGEDFMSQLMSLLDAFRRNEDGQDLLEYALLVALIALIAIGAVGMAGGSVSTIFTNIANSLNNAAGA
jgi:pilus assembly protein Flp/PilA